jgi:squalene-hopene/tetraprenyl-beta-curcumene cyclase
MKNRIEEMSLFLRRELLSRKPEGAIWRGRLSSSAISTAVSVFALHTIDKEKYARHIKNGVEWLKSTMKEDGSWGDTVESPSNMTVTLLTYASLYAVDAPSQKSNDFLAHKFGGLTDKHVIKGVRDYYGADLTFSAPIMVMCALAGVISDWEQIPQLPFEVSVLPRKMFRFLQLPVVSYAIPALIAVGILRYRKGKKNILSPLRKSFINKSLEALTGLQPANGGYLEAAPLTAFVSMCMTEAGYREHITTQKAADFLAGNAREDGAWPIDTDLANWVTSLSVRALGDYVEDKEALSTIVKKNAYKHRHPFTGANAGGWGWTDLPGAAPDADDTSGALVALHVLTDGVYCEEAGHGIEWLLDLQNNDGGMPTFCKGWGKLPFDRSSPDITAHAILAFELWQEKLPCGLQNRTKKSIRRMLDWMRKIQAPDGSVIPLWFGDQNAGDEKSPVYGTATAVEYLSCSKDPVAGLIAGKGVGFILSAQNKDGGWSGAKDVPSKVILTARALSALGSYQNVGMRSIDGEIIENGFRYLYDAYERGKLLSPEPIGLYFSRLWYSEELYNITFVLNALNRIRCFFS